MKTSGRTEWNGLPGYLRAHRLEAQHQTEEAAFNALEIGIDAETLSEFMREPTLALARKILKGTKGKDPRGVDVWLKENNDLLTFVMKMVTVGVLAERERAEREEEETGERQT